MVFTGGDPLKRPDIFELIRHSVSLGLRTNITPSATPLITREAIDRFKECGISRMAISLDGPDAASHDSFRGVSGTFATALRALRHAREIGLDTQIQTTVTRRNMNRLGEIAELAADVRTRLWSLFFLVVTGRVSVEDDLTAQEYEMVFDFLAHISDVAPFEVKTTEAMHYRRFLAQRAQRDHDPASPGARKQFRTAGVSDGRGFVFVSHTGEIYPSGFLPVSAGNKQVPVDGILVDNRSSYDRSYLETFGIATTAVWRSTSEGPFRNRFRATPTLVLMGRWGDILDIWQGDLAPRRVEGIVKAINHRLANPK